MTDYGEHLNREIPCSSDDEGSHWDPLIDVHVDHTEMANIQRQVFDKIPGSFA